MTIPVWGLLGIFTTTFVAPFVSAVTPVSLALPQEIEFDDYIANQIAEARFSSDPKHLLEINRAAGVETNEAKNSGAHLTAFIYNVDTCTTVGDEQSYRIIVRNIGNKTAKSVSVQNKYPEHTVLITHAPITTVNEQERLISWTSQDLSPGGLLSYTFETKTERHSL